MSTEQKRKTRTTELTLTSPDHTTNSPDYRELYRVVQNLDGRVSDLEESNEELETKNESLSETVEEIHQMVKQLSISVSELDDTVSDMEELEGALASLRSEDEELAGKIDEVLGLTQQNRRSAEHRLSSLTARVAGLEEYLSSDSESEDDVARLVPESACELEHLAAIPTDIRNVKVDGTPLKRAVVVWENFDEWADYSPHGYIIKSGDLRKFLQTALNEKIDWSPLYRVMAAFKQNTNSNYEFIDTGTTGKALIKVHDGVNIPEQDLVGKNNF